MAEMRILSPRVYERLAREAAVKGEKVTEAPVVESTSLKCPECNFIAKSAFGLLAHAKKHSQKGE